MVGAGDGALGAAVGTKPAMEDQEEDEEGAREVGRAGKKVRCGVGGGVDLRGRTGGSGGSVRAGRFNRFGLRRSLGWGGF